MVLLGRRKAFARRELAASDVIDTTLITERGDLRTLPYYWGEKGGMDGFYAARLRRLL